MSKFEDTLNKNLIHQANENIKNDLYANWCEGNLNLLDYDSDREWAEASGIDEVRQAFNNFYNLKPTDSDYLD